MNFRLALDLFYFGEPLVAVPRGCPGRINGSALAVDVDGVHVAIDRLALCEMANRSFPALRWPSIQFQRSSGACRVERAKRRSGTFRHSWKKTLRCMFRLSGVDVHS